VGSIAAREIAASPTDPIFATAGKHGLQVLDEETGRAIAEPSTGVVSEVEFSPEI
jgi:hypothetical protein